jgi:hypothetical protein
MVDFVFDHGAQQFPGGDRRALRRRNLALQVCWRKPLQNCGGLPVHAFHEGDDFSAAIGQCRPAALVAAGAA